MGLKSGTGDSQIDDESEDSSGQSADDTRTREQSQPADAAPAAPEPQSKANEGASGPSKSYLRRRDSTRDGRRLVQFFARESVYSSTDEDILKGMVGQRVANPVDNKLYDMDLREAMLAVVQRHEDEIVDELVAMGYERSTS